MNLVLDICLLGYDIIVERAGKQCGECSLITIKYKKESKDEREINWYKYRVIISTATETSRSYF